VKDEFIISRAFQAPRERVWKAWTDPQELARWWGPAGVSVQILTLELRPGGIFHYAMSLPDKPPMHGKWIFREITPPAQMLFVNSFADAQGNISTHPLVTGWPRELLTTITLAEEAKDRTTVTIRWTPINATEEERRVFSEHHDSMRKGWGGTLDQLAAAVERKS
jgi:uncharacterized protein YndB with AHSA1/START domain